jgi:hypothetical protein
MVDSDYLNLKLFSKFICSWLSKEYIEEAVKKRRCGQGSIEFLFFDLKRFEGSV